MRINKNLRERDIERYLISEIDKLGGKAYKFSSPNNRAIPDRICFLPKGLVMLVECKAPGKKLTALQSKIIQHFRNLGTPVFVVDSKEKVSNLCVVIRNLLQDGKR